MTTKSSGASESDLAEARKRARLLKAQIELGADPQAEARAKKQFLTFQSFFNYHYLPHVQQHKRSWKHDEEMYRLHINALIGEKPLNKLSRSEVQRFHNSLVEEGLSPATADHYLKLLLVAAYWSTTTSLKAPSRSVCYMKTAAQRSVA